MGSVLLDVVLPIFAVPALGYATGKSGLFDATMAAAVNRFVMYIALPALVFGLLANAPFERFEWSALIGYMAAELVVYALGFFVAWTLFKCEFREAMLIGMAGCFVNHVLFVLPIALNLHGADASLPITAIVAVDSLLVFGGTIVLMEVLAGRGSTKRVARKIVTNPMLIALSTGLFIGLMDIPLPKGLNVYLKFAGGAAAPGALFALGVILAAQDPSRRPWLPVVITAFKLIVHPILAWLCIIVFLEIPIDVARPTMMVAAGPCGAMAFVLALTYGVRLNSIARAILYSTIGSLVTVTVVAAY